MAGNIALAPQNVYVRFQSRQCQGQPGDPIPHYYQSEWPLANLTPPSGLSNQISFKGEKNFNDTAIAGFTDSTTVFNQTNLDNLAQQIAQDYINYLYLSFDYIYNGVLDIVPAAVYDFIFVEISEEDCKTRTMSAPPISYPEEMNHYDPGVDFAGNNCQFSAMPCIFFYGAPTCSGSNLRIPRYRLCLEDGRLIAYFVQYDSVPQGSAQGNPGTTSGGTTAPAPPGILGGGPGGSGPTGGGSTTGGSGGSGTGGSGGSGGGGISPIGPLPP